MWYPPPVVVPYYLDHFSCRGSEVPSTVMWQVIPFDPQMYVDMNRRVGLRDFPLSVQDERKFLLNKSVFDLVKVTRFLELTDPKLLGWYLCLPPEDRKLIQEEGGFFHFLQNHPALQVTRNIVHLKQQVLGNSLTLTSNDMSSELNKSRQPTFYGTSSCLSCGTSCTSRAKVCSQCSMPLNSEENVHVTEESLGLLPNSVKEELNLINAKTPAVPVRNFDQLGCLTSTFNKSATLAVSSNSGQESFADPHPKHTSPDQQNMHSIKAQYLSHLCEEGVWNDGTDVRVFKDPSAQASFMLDMELELQSRTQKSGQDQVSVLKDTNADVSYLYKESPPEYYSLNSTGLEHTSAQWSDATESLEPSNSLMPNKGSPEVSTVDQPVQNSVFSDAENCPIPDSVSCNSSEWTDFTDDYQDLDSENDSECKPKADKYGLVDGVLDTPCGLISINPHWSGLCSGSEQCTPDRVSASEESFLSVGQNELKIKSSRPYEKCEATPVSLRVSQAVDATSDFRACFTSTQATEICQNVFVKLCQNIAVGTDSFTYCEQETQTAEMSTSEKSIVTEVRMSDLDVLSEEFEYLKIMEEEFKCVKDKMARSSPHWVGGPGSKGRKSGCDCNAVCRAQRAELRLLALQFAMCQQHCWRRFYTSPLGETALQGTKALPDVMSQTLKALENDYLDMKRKILAGIHLDDLNPLSVDTTWLTTGTCYSPALVVEDYLGDVLLEELSRNHEDEGQLDQGYEVFKMESLDAGMISRITPPTQVSQQDDATSELKGVTNRRCRAMSVLNQQSSISSDTKPDSSTKDLNSSEAWFDAEEELASAAQDCKKERQMGACDGEDTKMEQKEDRNGNTDLSSMLCVTDLPSHITESDLLLWFEQYHASQVNLTFNKKNRAAKVIVSGPSDAEAAVREVNGRSIQGHTLHVEHIHTSPAGGQGLIKGSCAEHFPAACKAQPAGEGLSTHGSMNNFHSSRPLRCSLDRLINIQDKPSASGTYVPQHYATMGSFDTLMARLSKRHPEVSRKRIVSALLELRAKHHGLLSGLPLRAILEMASDLLTQQPPTE